MNAEYTLCVEQAVDRAFAKVIDGSIRLEDVRGAVMYDLCASYARQLAADAVKRAISGATTEGRGYA